MMLNSYFFVVVLLSVRAAVYGSRHLLGIILRVLWSDAHRGQHAGNTGGPSGPACAMSNPGILRDTAASTSLLGCLGRLAILAPDIQRTVNSCQHRMLRLIDPCRDPKQFTGKVRCHDDVRIGYTNSIRNCRPTACAARVSVPSVTDSLSGSSKRSSCARLVFIRLAKVDFVRPWSCMRASS